MALDVGVSVGDTSIDVEADVDNGRVSVGGSSEELGTSGGVSVGGGSGGTDVGTPAGGSGGSASGGQLPDGQVSAPSPEVGLPSLGTGGDALRQRQASAELPIIDCRDANTASAYADICAKFGPRPAAAEAEQDEPSRAPSKPRASSAKSDESPAPSRPKAAAKPMGLIELAAVPGQLDQAIDDRRVILIYLSELTQAAAEVKLEHAASTGADEPSEVEAVVQASNEIGAILERYHVPVIAVVAINVTITGTTEILVDGSPGGPALPEPEAPITTNAYLPSATEANPAVAAIQIAARGESIEPLPEAAMWNAAPVETASIATHPAPALPPETRALRAFLNLNDVTQPEGIKKVPQALAARADACAAAATIGLGTAAATPAGWDAGVTLRVSEFAAGPLSSSTAAASHARGSIASLDNPEKPLSAEAVATTSPPFSATAVDLVLQSHEEAEQAAQDVTGSIVPAEIIASDTARERLLQQLLSPAFTQDDCGPTARTASVPGMP